MDFKERGLARITASMLACESLEDYTGKVAAVKESATEGVLDEAVIYQAAQNDLIYYITKEVFATIDGAKIFFDKNPEEAYRQFIAMLERPEVRTSIITKLAQSQSAVAPLDGFTDAMNERSAIVSRCESLRRKIMAKEEAVSQLKGVYEDMRETAQAKYPGIFDVPADEDDEPPAKRKEWKE